MRKGCWGSLLSDKLWLVLRCDKPEFVGELRFRSAILRYY